MNTNIENCNIELLNEQKEQLKYEITQGDSSGFFNVFDIEAGCRKTRTAESALIEAYYKYGRKSILVRRNDEDCRESMRIINKAAKSDIAFAYNNEDVTLSDLKNVNKNLNTIPIVIITHQKYRVLMKDSNKRKLFSNDRKNLIVDEFISTVEVISVSEADIETFRILFKKDPIISQAFEKAMKWIVDFFMTWNKENSCRRFVNIDDEHPSKNFSELIKLIKANVTNEILAEWKYGIFEYTNPVEINIDLLTSLKTVKMLCDRLMEYKQLFTEMCVYNDKKLYTTDPRNNYWFLDNNIMLDASGELQSAYALNHDEFSLQHCEKVLNHSNWKIINIPVNTTSAGKERIINFYDVVNEEIKKYGKDILVIGKKNEMDMIDVPEDNKGYFGNVTGSNKWYDIKNVAIIQTHNLSDVDYILKYLHYGKKKIEEKINLNGYRSGRTGYSSYSFKDERLEEIRVRWIASEIYQAIKRVNRNMQYNTDVLIFINNEKVIELLKSQMKNCKYEVIEYDDDKFSFIRNKQDDYIDRLQKSSYATKFIDFLAEVQNGLHQEFVDDKNRLSKVKVRNYLGINSSGNFSNKVLKKTEVIKYCQVRNIDLSGQYIKLPKTG